MVSDLLTAVRHLLYVLNPVGDSGGVNCACRPENAPASHFIICVNPLSSCSCVTDAQQRGGKGFVGSKWKKHERMSERVSVTTLMGGLAFNANARSFLALLIVFSGKTRELSLFQTLGRFGSGFLSLN